MQPDPAHGPADYALFVGGKLLGIIEAKKVTVSPQNVLEQAKRYATGANGCGNRNGSPVPFLYAASEIALGSKLGIDATKKLPGECFNRAWPLLIKVDAAAKAKVGNL